MHICAHICICAFMYAYMHAYMLICKHIRIYARMYAYIHAYMHKCAHIYTYMLSYMHICTHICIYGLEQRTCGFNKVAGFVKLAGRWVRFELTKYSDAILAQASKHWSSSSFPAHPTLGAPLLRMFYIGMYRQYIGLVVGPASQHYRSYAAIAQPITCIPFTQHYRLNHLEHFLAV